MYPSLDQLRAALGLYEVAKAEGEAYAPAPGAVLEVRWACGCSARGSDMSAMEHFNCKRHEQIRAALPFPGDRRKTRPV
jgi:hypothetical protein